jgi:FemAB-related protein (PEP-CTERM system-associated)
MAQASLLMNHSISEVTTLAVKPVVRELGETETEGWTKFVTAHPEANLYHTLVWRDVVREAFGHQPIYLLCEQRGAVCGVLPMFLVKFPLVGSKLISMPYDIGSGGALAVDEASECALVKQAMALAYELQVNYLELRYASQRPVIESLGLQCSEPVLISDMELDTEAQVWARLEKDHRKAIRQAENRGVTIREANSPEDFYGFYQVYLRVFRDFGTPPYGANYFSTLWQRLHASKMVRLLLAYIDQRCVGGLLLFCWGKNLVSKFAVCLPEAVPLRAYVALYWRAIQLGLELGYRRLSWGTSSRDQSGLIEFKERWGASSRPAVFYNLPMKGNVPRIEKYYDSGGLARRLWRMLPLSTTRVVGGFLNRWFC